MMKQKVKSSKIIIANPALNVKNETKITQGGENSKVAIEDLSMVAPLPVLLNPSACSQVDIIVLGVEGSGANSFAGRFVGEMVGAEGSSRVVSFKDRFIPVRIRVFHQTEQLDSQVIKRAHGVVVVCDSTNLTTIKGAIKWRKEVETARDSFGLPRLTSILAVNKCDRAAGVKETKKSQIESAVISENTNFDKTFFVSALTGLNVEACFSHLVESAVITRLLEGKIIKPAGETSTRAERPSTCAIC